MTIKPRLGKTFLLQEIVDFPKKKWRILLTICSIIQSKIGSYITPNHLQVSQVQSFHMLSMNYREQCHLPLWELIMFMNHWLTLQCDTHQPSTSRECPDQSEDFNLTDSSDSE